MATEFLDPNSTVTTSWTIPSSHTSIDDAVRSPTNANSGGDGNNLTCDIKNDTGEERFGCPNAVNAGTASSISVKAYAFSGATVSLYGNVRIANVWQTIANMNLVQDVEGWYTATFNGTWDMATLTNMGLGLQPGNALGIGDLLIYAAYLEITYAPSGGGPANTSLAIPQFGGVLSNLATNKVATLPHLT
jgi:hypothetical protein